MTFRIALAGSGDCLRNQLADLLRSSGFAVDLLPPGFLRTAFDRSPPAYEVIIVGTDLAAEIDEAKLLESPLARTGYFIFEEKDDCSDPMPSYLLHKCMSQEDIIARLNGAIYRNLNRSRSARIRVHLPVEYRCCGVCHQSTIHEISENGLFIMALSPLPDGSEVDMTFSLPSPDRTIIAKGRTLYSIRCDLDRHIIAHPKSDSTSIIAFPGMGVLFDALQPADREAISDFLLQNQ